MIKHSQFFTQQLIASALVDMVPTVGVSKILDLGIGDGALSLAALNRFANAKVDAMDIDPDIYNKYQNDFSNKINVYLGDALCSEDLNVLQKGVYDLAVCNPPFGTIKKTEEFNTLFSQIGFDSCIELKNISKDMIFMCHCLNYVRDGGCVAIILPDGPLSRKDYRPFRKCLLTTHCVERIVQMPEKAFSCTEATTHILIVRKNGISNDEIPVSVMNSDGTITDECMVNRETLVERMDYSFCVWSKNFQTIASDRDTRVEIKRGSLSYCNLKKMECPYLHSTDFKDGQVISCINYDYITTSKVIARQGDIIMCRVGKRCVGKVAMISDGTMLLSDCLYKISVPKEYNSLLFDQLCSQETKEWVSAVAHGVCSRVISKSDLHDYITSVLIKIDAPVLYHVVTSTSNPQLIPIRNLSGSKMLGNIMSDS